MGYTTQILDVQSIKALIDSQFASVTWNNYKQADFDGFKSTFHPNATLYTSDLPHSAQTPDQFIATLQAQSKSTRRTFQETALKTDVQVSGKIATAIVDCENIANGTEIHRTIEMLMLAKGKDGWKIISQAWDIARPVEPVQDAWSI